MHRLPEALQLRGKPLADIRESMGEILDLVGASEIAGRAGVSRSAINKWRVRYDDFPKPVTELAQGPVWWWPEVESYIRDRGLAQGRGRPTTKAEPED